jgi:hypothetical protein
MKTPKDSMRGLSLIEVQVTLVVALVTVLGAIQFRFYSAKAGTRAEAYYVATQTGNHILKTWRASGQLADFDPVTRLSGDDAAFSITTFNSGLSIPTGMTLLGHYQVQSGDYHTIVTLAYQGETSNSPALRSVGVGWRNDYQAGALSANNDSVWVCLY